MEIVRWLVGRWKGGKREEEEDFQLVSKQY